jgi:hypothetical protein
MIVDKQGRIFGKVSLIDLLLLIVLVGLLLGFGFRRFSNKAVQIVNANKTFTVTFVVEKVRDFSINAVNEGDLFYQQYGQQPLGVVKAKTTRPAHEILKDNTTGLAHYVEMEGKYDLYITLECSGNVNDTGYFINGNVQVSQGSDLRLQSNRVLCGGRVSEVSQEDNQG